MQSIVQSSAVRKTTEKICPTCLPSPETLVNVRLFNTADQTGEEDLLHPHPLSAASLFL